MRTQIPLESDNPLRDLRDRRLPRIAGPCSLVIFGVTGDLSRKKLMPAVYDLANRGLLPPGFALVGFARRDWEDEDFEQVVYEAVKTYARTPFDDDVWNQLKQGIRFVQGEFDDDEAFDRLTSTINKLDAERGTRDPAQREREQFARLPGVIANALRGPGWAAHLAGVDPRKVSGHAALAKWRWPDGFVCPGCGKRRAVGLKSRPRLHECLDCGRQTSVTAGTTMHRSKLPLTTWFWAAHLMTTHSNGMSARQLEDQLGVTYKTAWLLTQKLRRSMQSGTARRGR